MKQTDHFSSSEITFYSHDMKSSTSSLNSENRLKIWDISKQNSIASARTKEFPFTFFHHLFPLLQRKDRHFRTSVFLLGYSCGIDKQAVLSAVCLVLQIGWPPNQTEVICLLNEM